MMGARYRLVRTIKSGGMAQVLEAVAVGAGGFERRVAVKRMLPHVAEREEHRRLFIDEARLASRIHHGSVVQILDYGQIEGDPLIVMEYVDGLDLAEAARRTRAAGGRVDEGIALHVTCEVANALMCVHGLRGEDGAPLELVHRDVSPQNILLSYEGDVKLSDFGIASARVQARPRTELGVVRGKTAYMAPEQLRGERPSAPADVYGLAATLHYVLTGASPNRGMSPVELAGGRPPAIDPALPDDLRRILAGALHPDPRMRWSAELLAEQTGRLATKRLGRDGRGALRGWLRGIAVPARANDQLDGVTGMLVVSEPGEERSFVVRPAEHAPAPPTAPTAQAAPAAPVAPSTPAPVPATREQPRPPRARRRWLAIALAAVGLALAGGGIAAAVLLMTGADDPPPAVESGQVIAGTLAPGDEQFEDGNYYDTHRIEPPPGATVRVTLESEAFKPLVLVYLSEEDEYAIEIGDSTEVAARSELTFVAGERSHYVVAVTSKMPGRGRYAVRVHVTPAPLAP